MTENNYSMFFDDLIHYNNNLFICDFDNKDYDIRKIDKFFLGELTPEWWI